MSDPTGTAWEQLKQTLPIRQRLRVRVTSHQPFGVFAEIPGVPFRGLIQITDFKDEGRMTDAEYPPVGETVEAVVLGFQESARNVWLGVRPSQLATAPPTQS